jgi:type VI secretion system protein ImpC
VTFDAANVLERLDRLIADQLDAILGHPSLRELERAWRSLWFVVERVDFTQNIRVELLVCSKDELRADFAASATDRGSGLHRIVYAPMLEPGGEPYGVIVGDYTFGPGGEDVALLRSCAAVAVMAHAPFVSGAGPQFFGLDDCRDVPNIPDVRDHLATLAQTPWTSFRESEDSRYVGLCMPRFLLRLPWAEEQVGGDHDRYLWGNSAMALATCIAGSFAKYRWCPNMIGRESGGVVEGLPLHRFEAAGEMHTKIPTEIVLTERREFEVSEAGFIGLTFRKDAAGSACFYSANSCQKPKYFGQSEEGRAAELNYRLGTRLPFLFIALRFAQHLKVLARDNRDIWPSPRHLEAPFNRFVGAHTADARVCTPEYRGTHPFRKARIEVLERDGFWAFDLKLRPHFKYMGAFFTLGVVCRLDATASVKPVLEPSPTVTSSPALGALSDRGWRDCSAALQPGGEALAMVSGDSEIVIWDLHSGVVRSTIETGKRLRSLRFRRDGSTLVATWQRGYQSEDDVYQELRGVERYNVADGQRIGGFEITGRLYEKYVSSERIIASEYVDAGPVWTLVELDLNTGRQRRLLDGEFNGATLSHDEQLLATSPERGHVEIRDRKSMALRDTLRVHFPGRLRFSPDARTLATGTMAVHLWTLGQPGELRTLAGSEHLVCYLDADTLVTSRGDGAIELWNVSELRRDQALHGHTDSVNRAERSDDGSVLLSEGRDGTVKLWDLAGGRCTATFACFQGGSVLLSPDGRYKLHGDPKAGFSPTDAHAQVPLDDHLPLIGDKC